VAATTRHLEYWIVGLVVGLDQAAKAVIRRGFELGGSVEVIPGLFNITRVHNPGAAFGMLSDVDFPFKAAVLTTAAAAALVGLAVYAASLPMAQWLTRLGLACIIGGAAGNLIDRLTIGFVVDFFDFYWRGWHFWAFNVADAAINVGVALMILDILGVGRHRVSRTA
jgi:signal peptidase II